MAGRLAVITGTSRGQSLHVRCLAEQKKAVITALDQFCKIPEKYGKPLLVRSMGTDSLTKEMLRAAKIPIFGSTEECALAMSALTSTARSAAGTNLRSRERSARGMPGDGICNEGAPLKSGAPSLL